jgi:hypothetical protein
VKSVLPECGAVGFDPERFLGTWHIVVTNYGYWKKRIDPTVTYDALPPIHGRRAWRDTLRFRQRGLLGGDFRPATLSGIDVELEPARFLWQGDGVLRLIKSPWWVLLVDEACTWAVTYFARSNVGTAPGMDLYGRKPDLAPALVAEILAKVRAHPFLSTRCAGLFATVQAELATDRYALG